MIASGLPLGSLRDSLPATIRAFALNALTLVTGCLKFEAEDPTHL
jgi:hypothetical protein